MSSKEKDIQAIVTLNQWGVPFLSSPFIREGISSLELTELLQQLITSQSARLKLGVTAFFLVHPEEAPIMLKALPLLKGNVQKLLKYYYMAAVYLQELWRSQLSGTTLPDYFSQELNLPQVMILHGRLGLASLEEALQHLVQRHYNYQSAFESLARLIQDKGPSREKTRQS